MNHIHGNDRNQIAMLSLEGCVAEDAFVRVIDAFVDAIAQKGFGFTNAITRRKEMTLWEAGLMFTIYKLMRCCTIILRVPELIKAQKKSSFGLFLAIKRLFAPPLSFQAILPVHIFHKNLYALCA